MKDLIASLIIFCACAWGTNICAAQPKPSWQSEWEKTVRAAKKEAKLSLYLYGGEGELSAVAQLFEKKYPEIHVTTVTGRGSQLAPRIMAERRAGNFLVDVYIGGSTTPYEVLYRAKILDPFRDVLILPEILDESKWWQGRHHYMDPENKYIFIFLGNVSQYLSYHTKSVDSGQLHSYWELLRPNWKGKILSRDPKISGSQRIGLRMFYYTPELGAEFIRRLYGEMDVTLSQDIRQATDWLAQARKFVEDKNGAPSRVIGELEGKLVNSVTGKPDSLDAASQPRYLVLYRGSSTCAITRKFTPTLVKYYNEMKPKHPEFEIARVSAIDLVDYQARVSLLVNKGVKLQDDAIVSIKTKGLIGEKYVRISPGASDKLIGPGGKIREVEAPVDLEELISKYIFGKV